MTALADTAAAARVRCSTMPDGTIHVYDHSGNCSVGRLRQTERGWRGVDDLTRDATQPCDTPADALAALLAMRGQP